MTGATPAVLPPDAVTLAGTGLVQLSLKVPLTTLTAPLGTLTDPLTWTLPRVRVIVTPPAIDSEGLPPLQLPVESVTIPLPLVPPARARPWALAATLIEGPIPRADMKASGTWWLELTSKVAIGPLTLLTMCSLSLEPVHVTSRVEAVQD